MYFILPGIQLIVLYILAIVSFVPIVCFFAGYLGNTTSNIDSSWFVKMKVVVFTWSLIRENTILWFGGFFLSSFTQGYANKTHLCILQIIVIYIISPQMTALDIYRTPQSPDKTVFFSTV